MLDLGAYLRPGLLDLALGFVHRIALAQLLAGTAAGSDLPDDLAPCVRFAPLHAGTARVATDYVSLPCSSWPTRVRSATLAAVPTTLCTRPDSASAPMCAFMSKYHRWH